MKPVTQHPNGCLMACVASILEIELDALPDLNAECVARGGENAWWDVLIEALAARGYVPVQYDRESPQIAPPGYHIAVGINPRHGLHATVARDGQIVHDPEPDRLGLERITSWILLMPKAA